MDKIDLISQIVKEHGVIEYHLNLVDNIGDEITIIETHGQFNDEGYVYFNLSGISRREVIEANIAKRWGVEFGDHETMYTRSTNQRDFYNLLQAMIECFTYAKFERQRWGLKS